MTIGFSTGSLAKGDFKMALEMLSDHPRVTAVELSALREAELPGLIANLPLLNLSQFKYISVHAPSKLFNHSEDSIIEQLQQITGKSISVIVHPDIITNFSKWKGLGTFLCIENMDKRKPVGQTANDLCRIFEKLPDATFCLDLAHAKQVDPTMVECATMLRVFKDRISQFHISDVTSNSAHVPINVEAIKSFRKVAQLIPTKDIPFIIESPVPKNYISKEIDFVGSAFHVNNHFSHLNFPFAVDDSGGYAFHS